MCVCVSFWRSDFGEIISACSRVQIYKFELERDVGRTEGTHWSTLKHIGVHWNTKTHIGASAIKPARTSSRALEIL